MAGAAKLFHQGEFQQAEEAVDAHLEKDTDPDLDTRLLAARIYIAANRHYKAHVILEKVIKDGTRDFRPYFVYADLNIRLGGLAEAIRALRESIKLNPAHGPSYLLLAKYSPHRPECETWLRRVLILEPRDSHWAKDALEILTDLKKRRDAKTPSSPDSN